jgi:single-stranded-DNA-specific exonuclease
MTPEGPALRQFSGTISGQPAGVQSVERRRFIVREFFSKVAGVTHLQGGIDPQALLKKCKGGQELRLIRDPQNKYDENAIKVCIASGEQIDWIAHDLAERLSEQLDRGENITATIANVSGGGAKGRGCNIKIRVE